MSFIKFESSRVKKEERQGIREAREKILEKAKKDYFRRKEEEVQGKLRGDDKWMLPSVEARLGKKSKKKKSKKSKHRKKKKTKKHSSSSSSSSSDSESEEDEWVVKGAIAKDEGCSKNHSSKGKAESDVNVERDEWMSLPGIFPSVSREELKQSKLKDEKNEDQRNLLDKPGQSERELNPYWRDGGTGLPMSEQSIERSSGAGGGVGDKGVGWLKRALRRVQEQAEEEGRTLEDVAAERWGSLKKLQSMIAEASVKDGRGKLTGGSRSPDRHGHHRRWGQDERRSRGEGEKREDKGKILHSRGMPSWMPSTSSSHSKSTFRKPLEGDEEGAGGSSLGFRKPCSGDQHLRVEPLKSGYKGSGNWRKKASGNDFVQKEEKADCRVKERAVSSSSGENSGEEESDKRGEEKLLTDQEMNELGAKLVKAEILGNEELAKELKMKLEKAREVRKKLVASCGEGIIREDGNNGKEEVVVLTRTSAQGLTRPAALSSFKESSEMWGGRSGRKKKGAKVETHSEGKRVRYFADDDRYSLREMFEREKLNTVEDSNEMFSKLAAKGVGKIEGVNDMDDIFEENARFTKSSHEEEALERSRAIAEHRKTTKALDNCHWCLDSKLMLKHLIIAIGTKAYLSLPGYQSLTEGHCIIVPMSHVPCATVLDEDVWSEIQEFRKALTEMFHAKDQDCVFFETAVNLKRFPHMVLECVPMEKETGDLAPIYFKKAIQECEMEWSNNKKVVDLVNKDVRRAVPKGLPYFCVDFGLQNGFAHVIEDERQWPSNFAQEIIGGMLDLDHHLWRKKRAESFDNQRKKVLQFAKWWKNYDWTQKLKEKK